VALTDNTLMLLANLTAGNPANPAASAGAPAVKVVRLNAGAVTHAHTMAVLPDDCLPKIVLAGSGTAPHTLRRTLADAGSRCAMGAGVVAA